MGPEFNSNDKASPRRRGLAVPGKLYRPVPASDATFCCHFTASAKSPASAQAAAIAAPAPDIAPVGQLACSGGECDCELAVAILGVGAGLADQAGSR